MTPTNELDQLRHRIMNLEDEFEELIYALSHDLRQPIVSVRGFTAILREDLEDDLDPEHLGFLDRVIDNANKMERILSALLVLSRAARHPDRAARTEVRAAFEAACTPLPPGAKDKGAQVTLAADVPDAILGAPADVTLLLAQLIENSLFFQNPEVIPVVSVGVIADDGPEAATHHHFFVRDNGMGIDPRFHETVFKVFQKLSARDHARVGLGLPICRKIVQRYGGRIWLESALGAGTTVHFTWPRT